MPKLPIGDPELYYQAAPLLLVPDVTGTAEYYRRVLGFVLDPEGASSEYSVVWRDHAAVHFARGETTPVGVRIFFWVKDVDRVHHEVAARGARITVPIATRPYRIRDFCVEDPNGITLVFAQDSE
jgi:catechol 2,3-dioxygenase-like lactoylglutathione lyase family enzyme